jgi:hypothetical protein
MNLQPLGNRIGSEMVFMITSNAVNRVFEPRQVKTKDNKIGICCFFSKYTDSNISIHVKNDCDDYLLITSCWFLVNTCVLCISGFEWPNDWGSDCITVILDMDGDVRFKAFFAESLIMQSKNTISGMARLCNFLGTASQDHCITIYRTSYIQWNDDVILFVLEQHA